MSHDARSRGIPSSHHRYSLIIADTVKIGSEGAIALTEGYYKLRDIVTSLADDEDEEEAPAPVKFKSGKPEKSKPTSNGNGKSPAKPSKGRTSGAGASKNFGINTKTRGARQAGPVEQTTAEKIKENQRRLHEDRQEAGLKKWENGGKAGNGKDEKAIKRYESYRREEQLPRAVEDRRVS